MSDNHTTDKDRLELFLADLDHYRTLVQPIDERIKQAEDLSLSFAKLALANLFVLNGGGLGAMPAFAAFLPHNLGASSFSSLLPAAAAFVIGLLAAMAAAGLSYAKFNAARASLDKLRAAALSSRRWLSENTALDTDLARASESGVSRIEFALERADEYRLSALAICSAALSTVSFIVGCLLALSAF